MIMSEHEKTQEQIWDEVGQQFDAMGKSLADAVDDTTQDEETRQYLKGIQADFTATVAQLNQKVQAAKESGESPDLDAEASKLGELSAKLGEQAKSTGQGMAQEVQPHLSGALSSVQEGVGRLANSLKRK
jgi:uncharacterized phage infection (PIP) family protein YhgE